jgi:hypothetical protein
MLFGPSVIDRAYEFIYDRRRASDCRRPPPRVGRGDGNDAAVRDGVSPRQPRRGGAVGFSPASFRHRSSRLRAAAAAKVTHTLRHLPKRLQPCAKSNFDRDAHCARHPGRHSDALNVMRPWSHGSASCNSLVTKHMVAAACVHQRRSWSKCCSPIASGQPRICNSPPARASSATRRSLSCSKPAVTQANSQGGASSQ